MHVVVMPEIHKTSRITEEKCIFSAMCRMSSICYVSTSKRFRRAVQYSTVIRFTSEMLSAWNAISGWLQLL